MYVEEYIDILQKAQDLDNACWDCWGYASSNGDYDPYYMEVMFDCTTELIERAIETAVFKDQRMRCEILSASVYYQGCYSSFFKAYDDGDEARLGVLRGRYSLAMERLKNAGYNLESFTWPKLYMFDKLDDLLIRFEEVLNELGEPGVTDNQEHFQKLMKEQSDLQPIVDAYREYKKNKETIQDSLSMLEEEKDEDMREMLKEELSEAKKNVEELEHELKILLLPKDPNDNKNVIVRSVQVQVGMRLPFLQQRFTVCM